MSELSFFPRTVPLSLAALAVEAAVALPVGSDPARLFRAVSALDRAGPDTVAAYAAGDIDDLSTTLAGACCVGALHAARVPSHTIALVTEEPLRALARIAAVMHPRRVGASLVFDHVGIDRAAIVHREAALEPGVVLDPGVIVGPNVEIGAGTTIGANSVIGAGVRIGRGCVIDAQVSIRNALIGDRVTILAGAQIGLDDGIADDGLPSLGRVVIQDDATIGANVVVERGRLGDTMIGEQARVGALAFVRTGSFIERRETRTPEPFSILQGKGPGPSRTVS